MSIKDSIKWIKENAPESVIRDVDKLSHDFYYLNKRHSNTVKMVKFGTITVQNIHSTLKDFYIGNMSESELIDKTYDIISEFCGYQQKECSSMEIDNILRAALKNESPGSP